MTFLGATLLCVSFWAAPGSPGPTRSVRRMAGPAAARARSCARPLEPGDFNRYDVIADRRLYRGEMTAEQLACLVSQLIRTRDRRTRLLFVGQFQNDLWEAVRRELLRLRRSPRISPELRARVRDLLAFDLSERMLRGSANARYVFLFDQLVDRDQSTRSLYRYALHEARVSGGLAINLAFARWRLQGSNSAQVSFFRGTISEQGAEESARQLRSYPALLVNSSLSLTERRARFRLVVSSQVNRIWDPLADRLSSRALLTSTAELRKPWSTGLGLRLVGSFRADRFAPPLSEDYNRQKIDRVAVSAEASYHFGRVGLISVYGYGDNETTTAFNITRNRSHTETLLGHLRFGWGYFRFGGGGGMWRESFQQLQDPEAAVTSGSAGHGRLELHWEPARWLSGTAVATVTANRSEGDFNGWYPSWSTKLKLTVSSRQLSAQVEAGFSGHHRDLDNRQDRLVGWSWAEVTFHPSDRWNLRGLSWGGRARQTIFQPYDESWWGGSLVVGLRAIWRPDLWIEASGSCSGYRYSDGSLNREQMRATGSLRLSGRF